MMDEIRDSFLCQKDLWHEGGDCTPCPVIVAVVGKVRLIFYLVVDYFEVLRSISDRIVWGHHLCLLMSFETQKNR
jgi:hypothetical protein